uniref:Ig-like domain-containing protein n=1 Tax=Callorhinchus milii TaxID=7868 RepID=A0A4W3J5P6_CALMI
MCLIICRTFPQLMQSINFTCNTTVSGPNFHWYTQYGKGSILFLVLGTKDFNMKDRISALANTRQRNCTLTIQNLRVRDTATYFCAEGTVLCVQEVPVQKLVVGIWLLID